MADHAAEGGNNDVLIRFALSTILITCHPFTRVTGMKEQNASNT